MPLTSILYSFRATRSNSTVSIGADVVVSIVLYFHNDKEVTWGFGLEVWFSLWVREVPGSIPGIPLSTWVEKYVPFFVSEKWCAHWYMNSTANHIMSWHFQYYVLFGCLQKFSKQCWNLPPFYSWRWKFCTRFCSAKRNAHSAGFEPARGDPSRFRVYRLNRSATNALLLFWGVDYNL